MLDFQTHLSELYQEQSKLHQLGWKHFLELGLPTKQNEAFRYVRLRDLYQRKFALPERDVSQHAPSASLVFVNGIYSEVLSSPPKEIVALPLAAAFTTYGNFLTPRITKQLEEEKDPFAALNAALYKGGLFIYVPPKTRCESLSIVHLAEEEGAVLNPKIHVHVGKEAFLDLYSTQSIRAKDVWINSMMDLSLDERAQVRLSSVLEVEESAWHFDAIRATLKRDSRFESYSVSNGGLSSRQDYVVKLLGEGSEACLNGVWDLVSGRHHHVNILMNHQEPNCISEQKFKGVLRGIARSSFEGKIHVHERAQKTQAYQMNANLILSKNASANSKPNLEIFADDVKASHGATIGQIDEELIFYLRTRGLSEDAARMLLVQAFIQEVLEQIPNKAAKQKALAILSA